MRGMVGGRIHVYEFQRNGPLVNLSLLANICVNVLVHMGGGASSEPRHARRRPRHLYYVMAAMRLHPAALPVDPPSTPTTPHPRLWPPQQLCCHTTGCSGGFYRETYSVSEKPEKQPMRTRDWFRREAIVESPPDSTVFQLVYLNVCIPSSLVSWTLTVFRGF